MYSWGSDDTKDWRGSGGYDYSKARAYLDDIGKASRAKGARGYSSGSGPDMDMVNPYGISIESLSENPVIIATDVTGSMSSWPAEIFDRLPLIYQTLVQYRPDVELCFAAIGDATCDSFPIQVNKFGKGLDLEDHVNAMYPEGGGGGGHKESYELFGMYALHNINTPNAKSPFLIMFGDEGFYHNVDPNQVAHYLGGSLETSMDSKEMWSQLLTKFNVYLIHKEYGDGSRDPGIVQQWKEALGDQRVITAISQERVVDQALALISKAWGYYDDFKGSIKARHDGTVVDSVADSIRHVDARDPGATKSVLKLPSGGAKSRRLDEMDFD